VAEEVERQRGLVAVRDVLSDRGVTEGDVPREPDDVTHMFEDTGSKVLAGAIKKGGKVLALRLPGFEGLLKGPDGEDGTRRRLGTELAGYAISMGLRGVFHSDEMPAYGVTAGEVEALNGELGCGGGDAFVLAAGPDAVVTAAMEAVAGRAAAACGEMQPEVRGAQPDGTTRFMRPLPGSARMYPETDVPPVRLTPQLLAAVAEMPVELPEQWVERISRDQGLAPAQAEQLLNRGQDAAFEALVARHDPKLVGLVLLSVLPEMERDGVEVDVVEEATLDGALAGVAKGLYSKEVLAQVLARMVERGEGAKEASKALGMGSVDRDEVVARIDAIVAEREEFVRQRGRGAMGPLMGEVMKEFRGQLDGQELSRLLGEAIDRVLDG
jgi:glutamyl-tRNA(Gln) amidotransferase subunit E